MGSGSSVGAQRASQDEVRDGGRGSRSSRCGAVMVISAGLNRSDRPESGGPERFTTARAGSPATIRRCLNEFLAEPADNRVARWETATIAGACKTKEPA